MLTGSGKRLDVNASGASSAGLEDLKVVDADVEFSGASHGTVNLTGRLDVTLSGASSMSYIGTPTLGRHNLSGASSMRQK